MPTRDELATAWDEGYAAAEYMAKCWGHVDSWEDEPSNPYRAAEPGVAVPEFVNETDEPADPTQAAIYWQRRLTDAQEAIYQAQGVFDAVRDLLWRATQYGETDDGDTAAYIVSKGTVHRLVGAMVAAGESAPLRNAGVAVPEPDEQQQPEWEYGLLTEFGWVPMTRGAKYNLHRRRVWHGPAEWVHDGTPAEPLQVTTDDGSTPVTIRPVTTEGDQR